MKQIKVCGLMLALSVSTVACSNDQKGTQPTTDTDASAAGTVESPTAATSSAGSSGMGGAAATHAIASDTLSADSSNQP